MNALIDLDRELFHAINHGWANPVLDAVYPWITRLQNLWPFLVVLAALLATKGGPRGRRCLLLIAVAVAISDPLAVRVVKPLVERERPCVELSDVRLLASRKSSLSFPSAHAVNLFAAATVIAHHFRRIGILALGIAAFVSFSRVYIGVHYPGDILGGALLGVAVGLGATRVGRFVLRRWRGKDPGQRPGRSTESMTPGLRRVDGLMSMQRQAAQGASK
jgi:undecaprenyl-diphosphatase